MMHAPQLFCQPSVFRAAVAFGENPFLLARLIEEVEKMESAKRAGNKRV
jgi:hypothetical protein